MTISHRFEKTTNSNILGLLLPRTRHYAKLLEMQVGETVYDLDGDSAIVLGATELNSGSMLAEVICRREYKRSIDDLMARLLKRYFYMDKKLIYLVIELK
jgi:hypothetical protein